MKHEAGEEVRSIDNPGRTGTVTNRVPREKASGTYYQVRWADGGIDYVPGELLEPVEALDAMDPLALAAEGRYGRARDLRRNLTYVQLSGRLANLVYSMGITNTDFYAHQYRPLLALLDSPINGLLIADEVGLGKTIEAGLIWTELRARFDMRRLLIVCPAILREKWRDELAYRFGVDARIVNAAELLDEIERGALWSGDGRALIASYQGLRPPRGWRPTTRSADSTRPNQARLAEFLNKQAESDALLDMVVFDEAHYMRNSDSATWRIGELLEGVSNYQIMLSATPINLKNRDLFNLLRLLDPDQFGDEIDFEQALEANRPLVAARDAALDYKAGAEDLNRHLSAALEHPRLMHSRQLKTIIDDQPTKKMLSDRQYRVRIADSLERINLLSHVVTRTRKRDVHANRVQREVSRQSVEMTEAERDLYEIVTRTIREYAWERDISDGFLLASPQRQITSAPAAVIEAWAKGGRYTSEQARDLEEDLENISDDSDRIEDVRPLRSLLASRIPKRVDLDELRRNDSKFNRLKSVLLEHFREYPAEKIIVFTSFRATARYLLERLNEVDIPASLVWGNQQQTKHEAIKDFRESASIRVLISTEVAAEGVDLQFCRVMVNYDLPWNPTRIEQRIGRIDRLGQKSPKVFIWNLYFAGTIDERVVTRLLDRLRIFEEALGESEAVVGEHIRELESRLLSRPLTAAQEAEALEQTAMALENIRQQREELERNAAHMMAHGQLVLDRIEAADKLARRVTATDLFVYVRDYLERYAPGHRMVQDIQDSKLVDMELPADLRARLEAFVQREGLQGKTGLGGAPVRCRFLNKISESAKPGEEIFHQFHPLIRFINQDLKDRKEHFYRLVAVSVALEGSELTLDAGNYVFSIRKFTFSGIRDEEILAIRVVNLISGEGLDEESSDLLIQSARLNGTAWLSARQELDAERVQSRLDALEEILEADYRKELESKHDENADRARFQEESVRRHLARRLPVLRRVYETHLENGRASLAKATQGQIEKLKNRMDTRIESIREKAKVLPSTDFICAGVIKLD